MLTFIGWLWTLEIWKMKKNLVHTSRAKSNSQLVVTDSKATIEKLRGNKCIVYLGLKFEDLIMLYVSILE